MPFEYDKHKSAANAEKHGIDFEAAQQLWLDPDLLVIPAKTVDEPRSLVIGRIRGKPWSAVITMRGDSVRIISVRRARAKEVELYEGC
jgi:uncharacterized DUF497 family protein